MNDNIVGFTSPPEDAKAVHHILELAEQGRFEYVVGQMLASYVLSADSNSAEYTALMQRVHEQTLNLMLDPALIWDGLLPGGPGVEPGWATIDRQEFIMYIEDLRDNGNLDGQAETLLESLGVKPDPNRYEVSLWQTYHPIELLEGPKRSFAESPLSFASTVIEMTRNHPGPVEEMAGLIVQGKNAWMMQYNQAMALSIFKEAEDRLNQHDFEVGSLFEDEHQAIQDSMFFSGQEFLNEEKYKNEMDKAK